MGIHGDGAAPRLWRLRAEWIPAYAGMTGQGAGGKGVGSRFRGNDGGRGGVGRRGGAPSGGRRTGGYCILLTFPLIYRQTARATRQREDMERLTAGHPEIRGLDPIEANRMQLRDLFPEAFTEGKADFDVLRQLLGDDVDAGEERYGLNWHGKRAARQLALTPSVGTLRPCPEESVNWDTTCNLMIEGDNLEVLKLLQKSYYGKVKLIYIDPPYNTGKDFIFTDDYHDSIANYKRLTRQVDGNGHKVTSNDETSGRFHTNWLNMLYPRLKIARDLLRPDGILVVSISDSEIHNLRHCLDEIFGSDNMVGCVMWNSTKSVTNTALISVAHTYNVIYARNRDYFVENRFHFRLPEEGNGFHNPDNDPRGPWKADPFQVGGERPNQMYPITNPNTGALYYPKPGNSWKNELRVFEELMADGRIVFGISGEAGPQRKRFLHDAEERGQVAKTWWDDLDTTTNATRAARILMEESVFDNPKPVSLIQRFIQLGVHDPNSSIIMDFFAGSGTTAQATLEQNSLDGGKRKYILVQLPEPLHINENSEKIAARFCDKIGRPRNLFELMKERLRRFMLKNTEDNPHAEVDLGFRVFKLDTTNIRAWEPDPESMLESLDDAVEHLKADRSEDDILYEVILRLGLDLAARIETREIAGKRVHIVGDGELVVCLATAIGPEEVDPLALGIIEWRKEFGAEETMLVFRDSAFADDVAKTNVNEILKQGGFSNVRSI